MPLVAGNGLQFHTQVLGQGPPLVVLHGLLVGNLASWYSGAAPALARTHRVLLYDLPVFLGNSFGGLLSLAFSAARPGRVAGMVLVGSCLLGPEWGGEMAETLALQGEERDRRIAHAFRSWLGRHSACKPTRLARPLPAAELPLHPGCTHSVLWEATAKVRRQVEQWLAGHALPAAAAGPAGGGSAR